MMRRNLLSLVLIGLLGILPMAQSYAKTVDKNLHGAVLEVPVDHGVSLTLTAPASSVFIASPDVADIQVVSPTSILVFGKRTGETTLVASDVDGKTILTERVVVTQDFTDLKKALDQVIPDNKIKISSVPNGIVLTGEARDPSAIEDARRLAARYVPKDGEIINRVKVKGSNQIQIRVRFAEVSRDVDKRFGVNMNAARSGTRSSLSMGTGSQFVNTDTSTNSFYKWLRTDTGNYMNDATVFSYAAGGFDISAMVDALAVDGYATILAEPSLMAMSGETASFLAGGEFPVPVPQGNSTISITFKQYGVSLAFTPTIIGDNRINMHVRPEVSQLSADGAITIDGIEVPSLTTRRVETTVELGSGQSFALAGLMNHNQSQTVSKYPFLGDLPILGALFRSDRFQNSETELVVIITPYIVKPTTEEQLSLPTDKLSPPSDSDRLLKFRSTSSDPEAPPLSGASRAVRVDTESLAPAPVQAKVVPVSPASSPAAVSAPVSAVPVSSPPVSTPLPTKKVESAPVMVSPEGTNVKGPVGYMVE